MWWVDALIVILLGAAGFAGTKRGMVLIGLELVSFIIATATAVALYHPLGGWLKQLAHLATPMSHVAAFIIVWVIIEIACAIIMRLTILRHLSREVQLSRLNQAGGAVLNALKFGLIITLSLIVFAGLPITQGTKRVVTDAQIPQWLLASTGQLQRWLGTGLGRDLGESLNFFTVEAEPESHQRIDLGYTTTGSVSRDDEDSMLSLINQERTTRGLSALTMNTTAQAVARAYSVDMFARGYFSHINPEGKGPFDRMRGGGVQYGTAGENLALAPTLQLAHTGLMNSPGHRANILSPKYHTVGIGIIDGGAYGLMVTQNFTD